MIHRKFRADRLFNGTGFEPAGTVLVTTAAGEILDLLPQQEAGEDLEYIPGILTPGWINTHCHLELSHMAGQIPPQSGMVPFLLGVLQGRHLRIAEQAAAMKKADTTMYAEGIVAVGDICNTTDSLAVKKTSPIRYHHFVETSGFVPSGAGHRYTQAKKVWESFDAIGSASVVPHAPYSVSPELFQKIFSEFPAISTLHNQESTDENLFFETGASRFRELFAAIGVSLDFFRPPGTSSLQAVLPLLRPVQKMILVHNTETSAADLQQLQENNKATQYFFCLCPGANLYINNRLPPIDLLRQQGCTLTLGTDSLASNHTLSLAAEIQLVQKYFPGIPLEEILRWVTFNGAVALGMEDKLGSFGKGKTPGMVQFNNGKSKRLL